MTQHAKAGTVHALKAARTVTNHSGATLRSAAQLVAAGLVAEQDAAALDAVAARYAIALTPDVAALIDRAASDDPIAKQYIPDARELIIAPGETPDPIGDDAHSPVEGVVHRYPDRVLLKLVHACAVYCRFCFRREMVGPNAATMLSGDVYDNALAYIRNHPEIWEVILTGGDPMILSPRRLHEVMRDLGQIAHVKIIRVHSRLPVVDPLRVDDAMIAALKAAGKPVWFALHANHPRELTIKARAACARLVDSGIVMVSQSVLLRGVNDNAQTLEALMRAFVECRIKPYYLHHGDLAPGTSHLRTTIEEGQALMRALRGRVSGLCQPEYVLDIPGGYGKSPIGPDYLGAAKNDSPQRQIADFCGDVHLYPPIAATPIEAERKER